MHEQGWADESTHEAAQRQVEEPFASMSSKPLVAMVAESTVIFGPMSQLGWQSASFGVTDWTAQQLDGRGRGHPMRLK